MTTKEQRNTHPGRKLEIKSNSHRAFMPKAGGIVWYQSRLEFLIALWFETRADVVSAIPHGFVIEENIGRRTKWTMDSLVRTQDGHQQIVEIKPVGKLVEDAAGAMSPVGWDDLRDWCTSNGQQPVFYTEEVIADNAQLIANWLRIRPYLQLAYQLPDPKLDDLIEALIDRAPQFSLASIVKELPAVSPQHVISHLFHLLHCGRVFGNLESDELSAKTWFSIGELDASGNTPEKEALDGPFPYLLSNPITAPRTSDPKSWELLPTALVPLLKMPIKVYRRAPKYAKSSRHVRARTAIV